MYSNWSEYSHRTHEGERSSRKRDNNNDRWEGKVEAQIPRDSYQNYRGDGHGSTERGSRSREYISSPSRQTSKDSSTRDWGRRRVSSSPAWDAPEKRSRRYTEDDDGDGRYRRESLDQPPGDGFSHNHKSKDFKHAPPREDDFRYRRTPPDFRSRNWRDEFTQREQQEDLNDRDFLKRFDAINDSKRRWDRPQERTRSPDHFTRTYIDRERMDNPPSSVSREDYYQGRTRGVDVSSREAFGSDSASLNTSVPERTSSKGFQRFLDVLNMGVNVDALNKIVSQPSTEVVSQSSFVNSVDHLWPSGFTERQQNLPASDERLPRGTDGRESLSQSPSVEKITLSPEDEEKRKQMQGVLQAIGVNLGLEELGQMTHRIQERLYGRKDGEEPRLSGERGKKQEFSSRHRSRSPTSSRSSFSPTTPDCSAKQDFPRSLTEVDPSRSQRSAEYSQMMSSSAFQSRGEIQTTSQTAGWNVPFPISTNPTPITPLTPTYSPVSCLPPMYPTPPAPPPPFFPPSGSQIFSPNFPPPPPHLPAPPNIDPHILARIRHLLPPPHPFLNTLHVNSWQVQNKAKTSKPLRSNTPPRPRCLHVIK